MAVKDKLELERLYAILDDLESMYKNEEISEETYTEMRKNYKSKIADIQDRIMDFDKEEEDILSKDVQEAKERLEESTAQISQNVNEILKETMRSLKMQLKSVGLEPSLKTFSKEDVSRVEMGDDEFLSLKCHIEWGKVSIRGSDRKDVKILAEKKAKADTREIGMEKLEDISLNCKTSLDGNIRKIKISPDLPKKSTVDLVIEVPNRNMNTFHVYSEKGKVSFSDIVCDDCEIENENGNVEIRNFKCKSVNVSTETSSINIDDLEANNDVEIYNENGNIKLSELRTERLKAYTEKGNISAKVYARKGNLKTELGSIQYTSIEDRPQQIMLSSELGSIKVKVKEKEVPWTIKTKVDLGSVKNSSKLVPRMNKERIFESSRGKDIMERIIINTSTDMGSIEIEE